MESEDEWTGSLNTCWLTAPACFARAFPTILITLFSVAEPVGVGMGNDPSVVIGRRDDCGFCTFAVGNSLINQSRCMNYSYLDASSTFLLLFCWNRVWVNARLTIRVQLWWTLQLST